MIIIDFHTHTFPDPLAAAALEKLQAASHTRPFTNGTVSALEQSMTEAGISASVVLPVATNARQVPHVNDASIALNVRGAETGVFSFGCMHPEFAEYRQELARLAAAGVKGIKLHPVYQGVDFDDARYLRILERAGELGLVVLVHAGLDVGFPGAEQAVPQKIERAMRAVGPLTLVLAHMGGWRCWAEAEALLAGSGAYIDTSFSLGQMTPNGDGHYKTEAELALLDGESFVRMVRSFGAERVLFGTDCPWGDQAAEVRRFLSLPFTEDERARILYKNAVDLLDLRE